MVSPLGRSFEGVGIFPLVCYPRFGYVCNKRHCPPLTDSAETRHGGWKEKGGKSVWYSFNLFSVLSLLFLLPAGLRK